VRYLDLVAAACSLGIFFSTQLNVEPFGGSGWLVAGALFVRCWLYEQKTGHTI